MKKLIFSMLAFGFAAYTVNAQTTTPNTVTTAPTTTTTTDTPDPNAGDITFTDETHDFGDIPQGTPVSFDFNFTNTGKEPLILSNVQTSCGCTSPSWPKDPILPGKSSKITVTYNAAHAGIFNKSITITSNGKTPTKVIYIKGNVLVPPTDQTTPTQDPNMMTTPKN